MSIVQLGSLEHEAVKDAACSLCGKPVTPPFVWWRGDGPDDRHDLLVCLECCHENGRPLALDLIQGEAIARMQEVASDGHAHNITLERELGGKCSICGRPYGGRGYDAAPINEGRCCERCQLDVVEEVYFAAYGRLPGR
jgi:hypothetical protein